MKAFDLETYNRLVAEGKTPKIVMRNGRDVRIIYTNRKCMGECIVALADIEGDGIEEILTFYADGGFYKGGEAEYDLFFADPEPTYRPYKDKEECFKDVVKHGGWVRDKYAIRQVSQITFKEPQGLVDDQVQIRGCNGRTYKEFLNDFTYADDGSPCGVKEDCDA